MSPLAWRNCICARAPDGCASCARCMDGRLGGRFCWHAMRACPSAFRCRAPNAGASCQVPLRPETMAQRSRRRPHCGGLGGGYGTERHTSYGSTVHRAGGPVSERQDDATRSNSCPNRRHPAPRHDRRGEHRRRCQQGGASSQDERRTLRRQHQFHGRHLYFHRLPGLG
jgi:hypothetical protein